MNLVRRLKEQGVQECRNKVYQNASGFYAMTMQWQYRAMLEGGLDSIEFAYNLNILELILVGI